MNSTSGPTDSMDHSSSSSSSSLEYKKKSNKDGWSMYTQDFVFDPDSTVDKPINDLTVIPANRLIRVSYAPKEGFIFKYTLSFLAACCAEGVTYPLDLCKTRLQLQGEKALQKYMKSEDGVKMLDIKKRGMFKTAYGIVTEEGFFKLWQGITPAVYRHLIYSGVRMTFYEYLRESILGKNPDGTIPIWKAIISGVTAGGFAQFLASPADLVKVHIQMEGRRKMQGLPPRVKGTHDAFMKIIREGGIRGLWKGWAPNVQRAAFVNLGDLTTYDTAKHMILKHTSLKDDHLTHALGSMFSGFIAATLGTPADVIKTRIMNQPTDIKGKGLLYKSSLDCLLQSVKMEGFFSLYKGFIPCWVRMGPWSLTFWLTYEEMRRITGVASF